MSTKDPMAAVLDGMAPHVWQGANSYLGLV